MTRQHALHEHHSKPHSPDSSYVCNTCGKNFRRNCSLKAHQSAHPINRNVCRVCGKSYVSKVRYRKHQILHSAHAILLLEYMSRNPDLGTN
ncbi:hypothetical protein TNCT_43181 [Trichonephila clavata]|uniref:C2H2-type domain-containing protein n=1 Tax=Trichonephila clavata TaxID=2740835 RepID=A0A8X6K2U0_TRICU|nr:hypothetical protein TNCT_43181 [Trichonephila clavata]